MLAALLRHSFCADGFTRSGHNFNHTMKTTIQIILSTLLFTAAQADTVYLSNVQTSVSAHFISGQVSQVDDGASPEIFLDDERGITAITVQPFFTVFDGEGEPVTSPTMYQAIRVADDRWHWFPISDTAPVTLTLWETWSTTSLSAQIGDDFGPMYNNLFRNDHVNEAQTWTYGFDVLSYEAVPEPAIVPLTLAGACVFGIWLLHRMHK